MNDAVRRLSWMLALFAFLMLVGCFYDVVPWYAVDICASMCDGHKGVVSVGHYVKDDTDFFSCQCSDGTRIMRWMN